MKNEMYTPEPWTFGGPGYSFIEDSESRFVVCSMRHKNGTFWKDYEANARRIVACVNACKGIETETLESESILSAQYKRAKNERALKEQNARLLDALKEAKETIEVWHGIGMTDSGKIKMWQTYNSQSPEMIKINAAISEAETPIHEKA